MKLAVACVVVVCALTASQASAAQPEAPSAKAATAAFGRLLHQLYWKTRGDWTCPDPSTFSCARDGGLITCRNALGDAMRYRPGTS
jgi:hypothetical protein